MPPLKNSSDQEQDNFFRNQIQKFEQWIVVGYLTPYICHEMNNSLQTIRGALALTLEQPDISPEMLSYLKLSHQETGRIARLVDDIRGLYRSETTKSFVDLNEISTGVLGIMSEQMKQQGILLHASIGKEMVGVVGFSFQMQFLLLTVLLNLIELNKINQEKDLFFQTTVQGRSAAIEMFIKKPLNRAGVQSIDWEKADSFFDNFLEYSRSGSIVKLHKGKIYKYSEGGKLGVRILLPIVKGSESARE